MDKGDDSTWNQDVESGDAKSYGGVVNLNILDLNAIDEGREPRN
jgi:hypothetical protein